MYECVCECVIMCVCASLSRRFQFVLAFSWLDFLLLHFIFVYRLIDWLIDCRWLCCCCCCRWPQRFKNVYYTPILFVPNNTVCRLHFVLFHLFFIFFFILYFIWTHFLAPIVFVLSVSCFTFFRALGGNVTGKKINVVYFAAQFVYVYATAFSSIFSLLFFVAYFRAHVKNAARQP